MNIINEEEFEEEEEICVRVTAQESDLSKYNDSTYEGYLCDGEYAD